MKEQLKKLLLSLEISEENIEKILNLEIFDTYVSKDELDNLVYEQTKSYVIDSEISIKLTKANAKNIVACKALVDVEKLDFDGTKVLGLDEQIEKIIADNPYMFEDFSYSPSSGVNKPSEQNMTDYEYFNYQKLNKNGGF